jgi:hypothetical protein
MILPARPNLSFSYGNGERHSRREARGQRTPARPRESGGGEGSAASISRPRAAAVGRPAMRGATAAAAPDNALASVRASWRALQRARVSACIGAILRGCVRDVRFCMRDCVSPCVLFGVRACVRACVRISLCVCVLKCVCVCVFVSACAPITHTQKHKHRHKHTHEHAYTHTRTNARARAHARTHARTARTPAAPTAHSGCRPYCAGQSAAPVRCGAVRCVVWTAPMRSVGQHHPARRGRVGIDRSPKYEPFPGGRHHSPHCALSAIDHARAYQRGY